jgi:P-type Cu+ transporter
MNVAARKAGKLNLAQCYHCGEDCVQKDLHFDNKSFCCEGCKLVYELLSESNLCTYYTLNESSGLSADQLKTGEFDYLDQEEIQKKLVQFSDAKQVHITFYIPKMHCSSCIWLLENLHKLNNGIISSAVNFLKKEAVIVYNKQELKLSGLVSILSTIGYEPLISLNDLSSPKVKKWNKPQLLKIGVAGFCFGNIMMFSFPEYFALGDFSVQPQLRSFFGIINLLLSLPVLFYSASDFFISSWKGIKQKFLNIDIPIAFAIAVTFSRSVYEILSGSGSGYLDSMSGIVFFMLLGRYFQNYTYDSLSFDRDYKSYFPIAVSVKINGKESSIPVEQLKKGDRIFIRNKELIPADSILKNEYTYIDYSFVTGESRPVKVLSGEVVYAGGRQIHGAVELEVLKEVSQSYLTSLWNKDQAATKSEQVSFIHKISRYFTIVLLTIALSSFLFWFMGGDLIRGLNSLTTVLIVACPCALLLSATFTNGNMIRLLGRAKFYVKNAGVIERISAIDTILFDKTGTITYGAAITFKGKQLNENEQDMIVTLASNSNHPLSRKICELFISSDKYVVNDFKEIAGAGVKGVIDENYIVMGSEFFITGNRSEITNDASRVFVMINGIVMGYYSIKHAYRTGIFSVIKELKGQFDVRLISGDNSSEHEVLSPVFGEPAMCFNQKPEDKSAYIKSLQSEGKKVMMIGDGLNDSGALLCSDAGLAISDDTNNFSPSCDAILQGKSLEKFNRILLFIKSGRRIIFASFIISIIYNIAGLFYAVQGLLSPVIAAILMPVSSISIVLFCTIASTLAARRKGII